MMFLLLGCEDQTPAPEDARIELNTAFSLRPPQKAHNDAVAVAVLQVQDSRCPQDVVCVWQGEVAVRLQVQTPQDRQEVVLSLRQPDAEGRNEAVVGGYRIMLEAVSMPPSHKAQWKTEDYEVRLRISQR